MLYRLAVVLKRTKEVIYCQVPLKKKKVTLLPYYYNFTYTIFSEKYHCCLNGKNNIEKINFIYKTKGLFLVYFLKRYSDGMFFFSDLNIWWKRLRPLVEFGTLAWLIFFWNYIDEFL